MNGFTRTWVPSDTCIALFYGKRAKAAQLDPVTTRHGSGDFFKNCIHNPFDISLIQVWILVCDFLNKFRPDHICPPGALFALVTRGDYRNKNPLRKQVAQAAGKNLQGEGAVSGEKIAFCRPCPSTRHNSAQNHCVVTHNDSAKQKAPHPKIRGPMSEFIALARRQRWISRRRLSARRPECRPAMRPSQRNHTVRRPLSLLRSRVP